MCQVRAHGIDTMALSVTGIWKNHEWFSCFRKMKSEAQEQSEDVNGIINTGGGSEWHFKMQPNGSHGYEWLLVSNDFVLRIGRWTTKHTRPNAMIEIRSEMLWRMGAVKAKNQIIDMLAGMGLEIETVKPSRVDLCLDMLVPKSMWNKNLIDYAVTKAFDRTIHMRQGESIKGISIGSGKLVARIYDKPLEIRQKSGKIWMFDIWGLDEIPKEKIMARVEFQIRREAIKEMKIDVIGDFFEQEKGVWLYCSEKWLKFQDNIEAKNRRSRRTLEWWIEVQDGYNKSQEANPIVRKRILEWSQKQLALQAYGVLISLQASELEKIDADVDQKIAINDVLHNFLDITTKQGKNEQEMNKKIKERRTKYRRMKAQEEV